MSRSFVVSILNHRLAVRSDGDEESVKRVAAYVSHRIREVMEKSKTASVLTASLLTCMNLADEALRIEQENKTSSLRIANKVRDLIGLMEHRLNGDSMAH